MENNNEAQNADESVCAQEQNAENQKENVSKEDVNKTPEQKIADLETELAGLKDQYLRKAADFDNFRKRMNKEKQEAIDFANQNLLLDLIPVIDDFERAIKAADGSTKTEADFDALNTGIKMVEQRLYSILENKWGLKRFDSAGEPFDPVRHEALIMEKSADVTDAIVNEDFMKGYTLKDRVVRPAKVKVLMPEDKTVEN
jgi:molecular chaperone GrpE